MKKQSQYKLFVLVSTFNISNNNGPSLVIIFSSYAEPVKFLHISFSQTMKCQGVKNKKLNFNFYTTVIISTVL